MAGHIVYRVAAVLAASVVAGVSGALGATPAQASPGHLTPAPQAGVSLGAQTITVSTARARAIITRDPFDITFTDGAGHPVLSEVPNTRPLPLLDPPTVYPSPLGGAPEKGLPLYAPLSFLVGTATTTQWGGGTLFFQGNESIGAVTGLQYAARAVISATTTGSGTGVSLTLSTTDPTGRRLLLSVAPQGDGAIRVSATPSPSAGVALLADSFSAPAGEAFHGFGGRHNGVNQARRDFYSWIEEENSSGIPGSQSLENLAAGQPGYMFPNGPAAAYTAQALFVSSQPYGFMLDQPEFARWRMASDRADAWQVQVYGDRVDYSVAPGPAARALGSLSRIDGAERVPPRWALGPTLDRTLAAEHEQSPALAQAQVVDDIAAIRREHLPITAYQLDAWCLLTPEQQRADVAALHRLGIHVLRYFRAFVSTPSAGWEDAGDYAYALSHHLVVSRANGQPATFGAPYENGTSALLDFTNPATVRWWQGRIDAALNAGADGFMQDFGEQVDAHWRFFDGETGAQMHNAYPILYDRVTRRIISAWMRRHPRRHVFFFTRAGYSGTPGSVASENAEFLGDNTTSWDDASGIASVIPDELNRSLGGAFGPDTDIGGYLNLLDPPTTPELFDRWAELSALTPFFRVHNSGETGTRMPWALGAQSLSIYRAMLALHDRAIPLILSLWAAGDRTGVPPMRPLWLADPRDPAAAGADEEWELGPNLLVAPIVSQGATSETVLLPHGCWREAGSGLRTPGPASVVVAAPLQRLPYFVRCGTHPLGRGSAR